jgi:hypothetical protein
MKMTQNKKLIMAKTGVSGGSTTSSDLFFSIWKRCLCTTKGVPLPKKSEKKGLENIAYPTYILGTLFFKNVEKNLLDEFSVEWKR